MSTNEPIAVVGSGCRFPGGASSPSKLWKLLKDPKDVQSKIGKDRFDIDSFYDRDGSYPGKGNARHAYLLEEDPYAFDASFFNINALEANAIDPQHRLLLETVYEGISSAGLRLEDLQGSSTAVYVGMMQHDFADITNYDLEAIPTYGATGTSAAILSNRVSYFFDWHGPSMTIDTACSSSLVAVHHAIQQLREGSSTVAVAAGANLILGPLPFVVESKLNMLSPTGRSRMWDADADGYARGEGVAAVVLKTLSQALLDGDNIECIIRESGVNQDGRTPGITMPSHKAQKDLIHQTYAKAGLDLSKPEDRCQFFEAHGTGTPAGDPQEAEAISSAFFGNASRATGENPLYVGSIKTVIGHTEGTAGIAGLMKASLAMKHGIMPPNLLFNRLAPRVAQFYDNLEIVTKAQAWPSLPDNVPRRVSVNSFGFGGTNAHVILESYQGTNSGVAAPTASVSPCLAPLTLSAVNEQALKANMKSLLQYLQTEPDIQMKDLVWTYLKKRSDLGTRRAIVGQTIPAVAAALTSEIALIEKKDSAAVSSGVNKKPSVMGIFTGQGAQWPAMGKLLISTIPVAKTIIQDLDESLKTLPEQYRPEWTLEEQLSLEGSDSDVANATYSQPLCCAVQIILLQLLKAAGLEFKAVVGHSSGEIACAYAANFVTASQAIRIAYLRGLTSKFAGAGGAMMAIGTSMEDAEALCALEMFEGRISVAASNSPDSCTVSGDKDAIEEAREILEDEGKFARVLKVDKAYHSHQMLPCAAPYVAALKESGCDISQAEGPPTCTWISSVYDGRVMTPKSCGAEYWKDNLVSPVLFSQAVEQTVIKHAPLDLGIEVGCHPALKKPCQDTVENCYSSEIPYTGCMERGRNDIDSFTSCLRYVWERFGSASLDLTRLYETLSLDASSADLSKMVPTYTWDHSRSYQKESRVTKTFLRPSTASHLLLGKLSPHSTSTSAQWHKFLRVKDFDWLDGHALQGQTVFPGAGYVVMGFEAAIHASEGREIQLLECLGLDINKAVTFEDEQSIVELNLTITTKSSGPTYASYDFTIDSCLARENTLGRSASGTIVISYGAALNDALPPAQDEHPHMGKIGIERFYRVLDDIGYGYTKEFRGLTSMKRADSKATGDVNFPQLLDGSHNLVLHPATLDVAFQTFIGAYSAPGDRRLRSLLVPTRIDRIALNPSLAVRAPSAVGFNSTSVENVKNSIGGNIEVFEPASRATILQVEGLSFKPFSPPTAADDRKMYSKWTWGNLQPDETFDDPQYYSTKEEEVEVAAMERVTYFYIRTLLAGLTGEDREDAAPHYQKQIAWCEHIVADSKAGKLPCYQSAWESDTEAEIQNVIKKYVYHPHIRLLQRVGENILEVIRDGGNPFDVMDHDGLLTEFYGSPKSYGNAYNYFAKLIRQISHRHQKMNILEIGGGTGGATRYVLKNDPPSFNSYTFTDISNAFFGKAAEEFAEHQDLMDFRPLDIRRDPKDQGFTANSYDLVIASNVLHATPSLDETLANVRTLLKPGGQLVIIEVTHREHSRIGFIFGLFADWWAGTSEGRVLEPFVSYDKWDEVMKRTGFTGIESRTLDRDSHVSPNSVFSTIAINEPMLKLTSPLSVTPTEPLAPLVIIGGDTSQTSSLVEQIQSYMPERQVDIVKRLADLPDLNCSPKSTFLVLSELDEEFFAGLNEIKFEAAQTIFAYAKHVMWVTESAWCNNPRQGQVIGLLRSLRLEHVDVQIQVVDYDLAANIDSKQLVEHLLRLEYSLDWEERGLLWTPEPEIYITGSRAAIQRLRPDDARNDRLNATRRPIFGEFHPTETTLRIENDGQHPYVEVVNEFAFPSTSTQSKSKIQAHYTTAKAFRVGDLGYFHLLQGSLTESGRSVLSLSESNMSAIDVLANQIYTLNTELDTCILPSVAANILAQSLLSKAVSGASMLVFEPPSFCVGAIIRLVEELGAKVTLASANPPPSTHPNLWMKLHEKETQHQLQRKLAKGFSVFCNLAGDDTDVNSTSLGSRLASCLPPSCSKYSLQYFVQDAGAALIHETNGQLANILEQASHAVIEAGATQEPVFVQASQVADIAVSADTVVQWKTQDQIAARLTSIGDGKLFSDDKTYLLVGLAGDLGRSICRFMIMHGARHVVLSSRHPTTDQRWIDDMIAIGGDVMILPMNVAHADSLDAGLAKIRESKPPIAGVAFGPLILQDVMFKNMELDLMEMVLEPKVNGACLLDERLPDLDFFVMFSSFVMVSGNPGQAAYSAANAYTVALAQSRRSRGLAGSAIDIGAVYGVGFVARAGREEEYDVVRFMFDAVNEWELQALFAEAVVSDRRRDADSVELITGMPVFDPAYRDQIPYYDDPRLSYFKLSDGKQKGGDANSAGGSVKDQLLKATTLDEVRQIIIAGVTDKIRSALQVPAEDTISVTTPLVDEGVDSLSAVAIGTWFTKNLDIDVPLLKILGGASVSDLVEDVMARLSSTAIPLAYEGGSESQEAAKSTDESSSNSSDLPSGSSSALDALTPMTSGLTTPSSHKYDGEIERQGSLSLIQDQTWNEMQLSLRSSVFNTVVGMYMQGPIDMSRLRLAVNTALQRHDIFRTSFVESDGKPVQIVHTSPRVQFEAIQVDDKAAAEKSMQDLRTFDFDVTKADTVKFVNYYWTPTEHLLILAYHRLVGDGWTTERLFVEVGSLYQGMQLGPAPKYADYAARQRTEMEAERLSPGLGYWKSQYSSLPPTLPVMKVPGAQARTVPSWAYHEVSARLPPMVAVRIKDRARKHKTTPVNFYLTAYHVMLARLTGSSDLSIGVADANRPTATDQATMGYFANYLPLRLSYESTETFGATLVAVKESMREALLHSTVPLGSILTALGIPHASQDALHAPLVQALFDYKQGQAESGTLGGAKMVDSDVKRAGQPHDIVLEMSDDPTKDPLITVKLQTSLYGEQDAAVVLEAFVGILTFFSRNPALRVDDGKLESAKPRT